MGHNRNGDVRVIWKKRRMRERRVTLPQAINQEQNDEGGKSKLTRLCKDSRAKLSSMRRTLTTVGVRAIQRGGCSRIVMRQERSSKQRVQRTEYECSARVVQSMVDRQGVCASRKGR